jgi:hypothetical protein
MRAAVVPLDVNATIAGERMASARSAAAAATACGGVDSAWTDEITADCHHAQARNQFDPCGAMCPHQATVA